MVTRAKAGISKPLAHMNCHATTTSPIPRSHLHALRDTNRHKAMVDEYNALIYNGTWALVPRLANVNIVRSMWIFKHKVNAYGSLSRYKARLVANGSNQQYGIDCDENFRPVAKSNTIHTVLSLVVTCDCPIHQLNVKNAFLHAQFSETVYIHQPPGFVDSSPLIMFVIAAFFPSKTNTSLFVYHKGSDVVYLLLYVDGIVLTASSTALLQRIITLLHRNSWRAHMHHCNPCKTPVDTESKLGSDGNPVSDPALYRSLAGALQHLTFTRPDISYLHVSSTSQLTAYTDADWVGCLVTSAKQQVILSRSSAEAEYRDVANGVAETVWLWNLLLELHAPLSTATLVYCDNVSVAYLSTNLVQHQRTKHIDIDIYFVREYVASGQVRVLHVPSRFQYADIFTKGLPTTLFFKFRSSLNVRRPPTQTAEEY
nr:ribonuclease H-like domain-containing protein [Tanacetum cinerariifolium]